jgi:hypothetical protein
MVYGMVHQRTLFKIAIFMKKSLSIRVLFALAGLNIARINSFAGPELNFVVFFPKKMKQLLVQSFSHKAALVSYLGNLSKLGQIHIVRELPVGLHLPGVNVQDLQSSVFLYREANTLITF